jgi:hypothetical protein
VEWLRLPDHHVHTGMSLEMRCVLTVQTDMKVSFVPISAVRPLVLFSGQSLLFILLRQKMSLLAKKAQEHKTITVIHPRALAANIQAISIVMSAI